jgi:DNA-binding CsgD family transcriptional regulator
MRGPSLESLLQTLYDANFSGPCFDPFLRSFGLAMRSHVLSVLSFDPTTGKAGIVNSIGLEPAVLTARPEEVGEDVWFAPSLPKLLTAGIADDEQLCSVQELHKSQYYADFLRPTEVEHSIGLCIHHGAREEFVTIAVGRHRQAGFFDDRERQLATRLLPHLRNAYTLHQRLRRLESIEQCYRTALDRLDEAAYFLGTDRRIVFANEKAQIVEAAGDLVGCRNGRLVAMRREDDVRLESMVLRMSSSVAKGDTQTLCLHDPYGQPAGLLTLCPTPAPALHSWSENNVAMIAFVRSLSASRGADSARLRAAWRLTDAESQVAALLARGLSPKHIAERLGVSKNTIRTQLRSLFDKTGTHRQGELVSLLVHVG